MTYTTNALGCRGRDAVIPNPGRERRLLVLGGSSAFGIGVRDGDTLGDQLAVRLNAPQDAAASPVVVINCAMAGAGTHDQRLFYEQIAERYEPQAVLLVMTERDNLSARDELAGGYVHTPDRLEAWFSLARLLQWSRHEGRRPYEFGSVAAELGQLHEAVETRRSRLAVALLRISPIDGPWSALQAAVTKGLDGTGVPVVDLGTALLASPDRARLAVHPFDPRPNHRAHAIAADTLASTVVRERLLQ